MPKEGQVFAVSRRAGWVFRIAPGQFWFAAGMDLHPTQRGDCPLLRRARVCESGVPSLPGPDNRPATGFTRHEDPPSRRVVYGGSGIKRKTPRIGAFWSV